MRKYIYLVMIAASMISCKKPKNEPVEPTPPVIVQYDKGDGIPADQFTVAFKDDFNDNTNKWLVQGRRPSYGDQQEIAGGKYKLTSDYGGSYGWTTSINFDHTKNYEIEFKYLSVNRRVQFNWGAKDGSGFGSFHAMSLEDNKFLYYHGVTFIREMATRSPIDIPMEGVVKIRKYNNKVYFFLNNTLLSSCEYVVNYGQGFAFYNRQAGITEYDYLYVHYIK
ncbi:hypothetical protein EA772_10300 [Pedobacter sp. G11]|uniref:hypothetical protein n=1 Tax=Pedobacter sp. G11 TaxID=2482728 RepID=UPI000F5DA54C|nr:hypothetical protein [Pedobacter sp. G11]AZI25717.1 hypothetical protein EA772_10300 [Pedobacter sp. G11]